MCCRRQGLSFARRRPDSLGERRFVVAAGGFRDVHEGNRHLLRWCVETAGRRVHGTTKRIPLDVFDQLERPALQPLPLMPWELVEWKRAKLHADCHVVFAGAYLCRSEISALPAELRGKVGDPAQTAGDQGRAGLRDRLPESSNSRCRRPGGT